MRYHIQDMKQKDIISGVYKISFPNGKSYIGISKNIRRRILEHNCSKTRCILYSVVQKYGKIENFELLEEIDFDKIPIEEILEKETNFIIAHQTLTTQNGYNILLKGDVSNLEKDWAYETYSKEQIELAIELLKFETTMTLDDIAESTSIHRAIITHINMGNKHYCFKGLDYPLRKYKTPTTKNNALSQQEVDKVIEFLKESRELVEKIAKTFKVSTSTIYAINNGLSPYHRQNEKYPIRNNKVNANFKLSDSEIAEIIFLLQSTKIPQVAIGQRFNVGRALIRKINQGVHHHSPQNLEYPLR